MQHFDLIIVGGGPIGIACALEAHKNQLNYCIIEKGCIVNSLYNYPANMQFFSSSEKLEIDEIPFICKEPKPKRTEALEYYRRIVNSNQLAVKLFEEVTEISKTDNQFSIKTAKDSYTADYTIIATGFYDIPNYIGVKGEELPKVSHYYKDPHFYAHQKVAVIGASNSAIDAALECYRKGAEVSLIIRDAEVGPRVKYWVRPDIINRIEEGSIRAYYYSQVKEITPTHIIFEEAGKTTSIENDFVLAMTGYRPNFAFLEKIGVALSTDEKKLPNYKSDTMETNVPNLYLAGVICGGMETHKWFIENSRIHAPIIIKDILNKTSSI